MLRSQALGQRVRRRRHCCLSLLLHFFLATTRRAPAAAPAFASRRCEGARAGGASHFQVEALGVGAAPGQRTELRSAGRVRLGVHTRPRAVEFKKRFWFPRPRFEETVSMLLFVLIHF